MAWALKAERVRVRAEVKPRRAVGELGRAGDAAGARGAVGCRARPRGADRARWKKEKGGGVQMHRRAGQARKGKKKRTGPVPVVGLKMEEGEFFKFKFFSNF